MPSTFPPSRDENLLTMATDFSTKVTATPVVFGYTSSLATQTAAAVAAYSVALQVALDPATRTKAKIALKNLKKQLLVENLRMMNRIAQSNPAITDDQKIELALPVYKSRTPINPPEQYPTVTVEKIVGRTVYLRLTSPGSERRGRPSGVQGAIVLSYTGTTPPSDPQDWRNEGLTTRTIFPVVFPTTTPAGALVWVSAAWYSPRGQAGPVAPAIQVYLAGGIGAVDDEPMKIAA
jgi:hypothetical protein